MGIRVYTEAVCDRCGEREQHEGPAGKLPRGWARVGTERLTTDEAPRLQERWQVFCDGCFNAWEGFVNEKTP